MSNYLMIPATKPDDVGLRENASVDLGPRQPAGMDRRATGGEQAPGARFYESAGGKHPRKTGSESTHIRFF
jgi:hypothetical protein